MSGERMRWEFRLGVVHVVVLLGIVTGSMVVSFVFGYVSGQKLGYDQAQNSSLANTARYPIAGDAYQNEIKPESVSEVYAKLNDNRAADAAAPAEPEVPELASIKAAEDAPVIEELAGALIPEESAGKKEKPADPLSADDLDQSVQARLDRQQTEKQGSTLGSLVKPREPIEPAAALEPLMKEEAVEAEDRVAKRVEKPAAIPAKAAEPVAKVAKPQQAAAKIPSGWYAQVAAPHRREDAQRLADQLKASGFPIVIEAANVNGQEYFRVLAGPERSRALADQLVQQLVREKNVQNKPFTKMIP